MAGGMSPIGASQGVGLLTPDVRKGGCSGIATQEGSSSGMWTGEWPGVANAELFRVQYVTRAERVPML